MNSLSSSSVSQSTSSTEPDGLHDSGGAGRAVGFGFRGGEEGGLRLGGGSVEGRAARSGSGGGARPVALSQFSNDNIPGCGTIKLGLWVMRLVTMMVAILSFCILKTYNMI
jgi:hypothetical protein